MGTFTPPAPPAFRGSSRTGKAARVVTDVLAPANLVIALLLLVGRHSTRSWTGSAGGCSAPCSAASSRSA
ncbi:hypothetical protein [Streptomyces sp. NRRL B-24484]|uniref:hypothetical protein n=1 Tax=Streptomyces sp. NRRL B-24484 TaxID=1463833 RepID=UPI001F17301D|nr:hypothetical protein [Streptomyces sp. NRRL B-24484]